jgi:metal transporter CNNM
MYGASLTKSISQAMTPIKDVFMLDIESKLDTETLRNIVETGHSRVPVYEEVEMSTAQSAPIGHKSYDGSVSSGAQKVKKIIGILLVKQCVLLDPKGESINITQ